MAVITSTLIKNDEISLGNTDKITIETTSQSIRLYRTTSDKIKVSQYGNPDAGEDELFQVSITGNDIYIYIKRKHTVEFFNFIGEEKLVVEIPESFSGNLDALASSGSIKVEDDFTLKDVSLNTSSGSAHIDGNLTADKLSLITTSGSVHFDGSIKAKVISASTTSGSIRSTMDMTAEEDIELNTNSGSIHTDRDITAKQIMANTSSGGLNMDNVYVDSYELQCLSGSIRIDKITGEGHAKTSSGSIHLTLESPKGDIYLNSSSGSINLNLEPTLQFTLTAETTSGGIRTSFPANKNERGNYATANVGDNPTVNIIAKASSGSISVEN